MLKKKLLTTASAVVVACGAMSIAAGSAQAGQLKVKMADVNIQCYDEPGDQDVPVEVGSTLHKDYDCYNVDVNGNVGPNQGPTGNRSLDKGFIHIPKPEGVFSHIALADERETNETTPTSGLYEVDLFEIEDGATFTPTIKVEINLSGDSDPWFKEDLNCVDVLRAGTDNVFSAGAFKDDLEIEPDGGIQADKNRAVCYIRTSQNGQVAPDSAIGFALPIKMKHCGDMVIDMTVTRFIEGVGPIGTETTGHQFVECRDSLHSWSGYYPTKIDYFYDFRSFLVDPNPHDEVEEHQASLWSVTGALHFDIWHNLTDLKWEGKGDEENVFDVTDIDSYELVVSFADLTGIKEFTLGGMPAYLDRYENTATWTLSEEQVASKFCLGDDLYEGDIIKGSSDDGCTQVFKVHAYGPDYYGDYYGPIEHQELVIAKSKFYFDDYETNGTHPAPFLAYETEQEGALVGHLLKTGINFGPFDWVADSNSMVQSVFRVTGIPKEEVEDLKGIISVINASDGKEFDGDYKVDYPDDRIVNHELLLTNNVVREMLEDAGMPDAADWGRADLTFSFFVPGSTGFKMDMDRLMFTNGVFAPFGDNSNDANSLKSLSCDDGRFGSHVPNKLDPLYKYLLTAKCSIGELDRRLPRPRP